MSFTSQISNYYESLVYEEIKFRFADEIHNKNEDFIIDMACVALNRLPARYYRFSVDMAFYLTSQEHHEMNRNVKEAVDYAIDFVKVRKKRQNPI